MLRNSWWIVLGTADSHPCRRWTVYTRTASRNPWSSRRIQCTARGKCKQFQLCLCLNYNGSRPHSHHPLYYENMLGKGKAYYLGILLGTPIYQDWSCSLRQVKDRGITKRVKVILPRSHLYISSTSSNKRWKGGAWWSGQLKLDTRSSNRLLS